MDDRTAAHKQQIDDIIKPNAVKSVSEEPESVTLQRLRNERATFFLVVCVAATFILITAFFLIYAYVAEGTTDDLKGRIVVGFIAALTGALGVVAGKKL